jgi:transposase InsO family protein
MYSFIQKNFPRVVKPTTKEYKPKIYNTPHMFGMKWQMDVKFVPSVCRNGVAILDKFYQYTIIDEATRRRFIYCYIEHSGDSTCNFIHRAIKFFGYKPIQIQTDNGTEFVNNHNPEYKNSTNKLHRAEQLLQELKINFKQIRPAIPRHNGKVERSQRNDQMWLYDHLKFNTLTELNKQLFIHLKLCNNAPNRMLDKTRKTSPSKRHQELLLTLLKLMRERGYNKITLQNAIYEYSKYSNNEYYKYVKNFNLSISDKYALALNSS